MADANNSQRRSLVVSPALQRTCVYSAGRVCADLSYEVQQCCQSSQVCCSGGLPHICMMSPSLYSWMFTSSLGFFCGHITVLLTLHNHKVLHKFSESRCFPHTWWGCEDGSELSDRRCLQCREWKGKGPQLFLVASLYCSQLWPVYANSPILCSVSEVVQDPGCEIMVNPRVLQLELRKV